MDLNDLTPPALKAAMIGGTDGWGQIASSARDVRYAEPAADRRRKCHCGCGGRRTHYGRCKGITLMSGCELSVMRWVRG